MERLLTVLTGVVHRPFWFKTPTRATPSLIRSELVWRDQDIAQSRMTTTLLAITPATAEMMVTIAGDNRPTVLMAVVRKIF